LGDDPARAEAQGRDADAALEYRAAHPDGYGYTWFCDRFGAFHRRTCATFRNRHVAGAVMQTDYAGQTVSIVGSGTGVIRQAQFFVGRAGRVALHLRPCLIQPKTARLD